MSKSYVGMGYEVCPICYTKHSETILLDRRIKDSLDKDNFLGFRFCPEHEKTKETHIALVEITNTTNQAKVKPENANPTGRYILMTKEVAKHILQGVELVALMYIDYATYEAIVNITKPEK